MIDIRNFFAPSIGPPGLNIVVAAGVILVGGVGVVVPTTLVALTANATNYVYLNTSTGGIVVNTTGFPASGDYPIAIAVTGRTGISSLIDSRADVAGTGTGGGGGGADTVLLASTTQNLTLPSSGNLYVDATAGAGGITLTLPTAVGLGGQRATVVMVDTGAGGVTLAGTISGNTNYELTNQWQSVTVESNNTSWRVTAAAN
jgi:hypothetical protein